MPFGVLPKYWNLSTGGAKAELALKHRPRNWKPTRAQYDEMAEQIVLPGGGFKHPEWGDPELHAAVSRREQALIEGGNKTVAKEKQWRRDVIDSNMRAVEERQKQIRREHKKTDNSKRDFERGADGIWRMKPEVSAMREWGLKKAGGIRYWDNAKSWDAQWRALPERTRAKYLDAARAEYKKRTSNLNPTLVRLTQEQDAERPRRTVTKKRFVAKKRKTPHMKKTLRKKTSLWTPGRKLAQKKCARNSFRTVKPNANTLITLCCPPGKWMPRKRKCKVSLRPHLKRVRSKRRA